MPITPKMNGVVVFLPKITMENPITKTRFRTFPTA